MHTPYSGDFELVASLGQRIVICKSDGRESVKAEWIEGDVTYTFNI